MSIILKALIYLIFFSVLHFGYDLTHLSFLKPFFGINESIFQHLKMVFWAYLLASLVEYPVYKRKNKKYESFWIPRFSQPRWCPGPFSWSGTWRRLPAVNSGCLIWS